MGQPQNQSATSSPKRRIRSFSKIIHGSCCNFSHLSISFSPNISTSADIGSRTQKSLAKRSPGGFGSQYHYPSTHKTFLRPQKATLPCSSRIQKNCINKFSFLQFFITNPQENTKNHYLSPLFFNEFSLSHPPTLSHGFPLCHRHNVSQHRPSGGDLGVASGRFRTRRHVEDFASRSGERHDRHLSAPSFRQRFPRPSTRKHGSHPSGSGNPRNLRLPCPRTHQNRV